MVDAVPFFFALGAVASLARSGLRLPAAVFETLSIYLLLAIGLKGGVEIARSESATLWVDALLAIGLGALIPLLVFPLFRLRFSRPMLRRDQHPGDADYRDKYQALAALGFEPEALPTLFGTPELTCSESGTITTDSSYQTSLPGVYAAGDIVRGASLVVWAIKDGRDAAAAIHQHLTHAVEKAT